MELTEELLGKLPMSLRIEIEENAMRKDLTQSELAAQQEQILEAIRTHGSQQGRRTDLETSGSFEPEVKLRATEAVAKIFGESRATLERRLAIVKAAKAEPEKHTDLVERMDGAGSVHGAYKDLQRRLKREELQANPPGEVTGIYDTITMDPPWPMEKIYRNSRPNQGGFDYPTMSEEELTAFDVGAMAADNCHLFCWTTQRFLPMALRLLDVWGFRYVCTFVWYKPGGFQPMDLPQYNCEFVLYARRGSPTFVTLKEFPTCFKAPRREHSRKPDEFYDMVKRVTAGKRIDVFSREARDGFAQYGNETDKFCQAP
jgi:N6-adenosine-specific RNA methylase IME4